MSEPTTPNGHTALPTIAANEDMEFGFMLADEAAPTDPEQREREFAILAVSEWDAHYDPAEISHRYAEPRPYKLGEDEESMVECEAAEAEEWWYVFDLPDEVQACGYCGEFLSHKTYCERHPDRLTDG